MTENEAIEALKLEGGIEITGRPIRLAQFFEGIDSAIKALEEVQQYREIGNVEECRAAVEKQREKKPIRNDKCTCPSCGTHNEVFKKRRNTVAHDIVYCWHCGQAVEIDRLEE